MSDPAVISCVNLKGGVGKTALAVNLAAFCGRKRLKTLLIDLDPQTNATFSCMQLDAWQEHATDNGTVANLLGARGHTTAEARPVSAADVVVPDVFTRVDLIPSHLDLFTVDLDLASATRRESKLERAIREIKDDYDVVVCDCPPNLTIPTQNAIAMSTHYVVPISPDFLSSIGVGLLINRIEQLSSDLEISLEIAGIVMSRVGRPSRARTETTNSLREAFPDLVLDSELKERSTVAEIAAQNIPIFDATNRDAIREFDNVCEEILDRVGVDYENA